MAKSEIYSYLFEAKHNKTILNELITGYMPFIKSCVKKQIFNDQSADDAMTMAMLAFARCVKSFDENKGDFFAFCEQAIRRSIIDDYRINSKHHDNVSLDETFDNTSNSNVFDNQVSILQFETLKQQQDLKNEIEVFSIELAQRGLSFKKLIKISPKQTRSRDLCFRIAETIINNPELANKYRRNNRIPQIEIANRLDISPKTVEKHRKYLSILLLILYGDYPLIRAFLPDIFERR